MPDPFLTIKMVARQTSLSAHVIRAWEKRYGAVKPVRSSNSRRVYSANDVARLNLLRRAVHAGHSIGQVANLPNARLTKLVREAGVSSSAERISAPDAEQFIAAAIARIRQLDASGLNDVLDQAAIAFGSPALLHKIIAPIAARVGELWRLGDLSIRQERFMTTTVTAFLAAFARPYAEPAGAPHMIVTTPSGQLHEMGAILATAAARSHGWKATYLGASLPVEELIGTVQQLHPQAVGISIVYPQNDPEVRRDLIKLAKLLPSGCTLVVGGRSAHTYAETLRSVGATQIEKLEDLYQCLDRITNGRVTSAGSMKRRRRS